MIEEFKNKPTMVTPPRDIGLTAEQREKLQRVAGLIDACCYIAQDDMANALTIAFEAMEEILAEDMERKRGVPCEI